jgi:hypothetical protein
VTPLAHVAGVPVEELLPSLAGAGSALLLARGWLSLYLRRSARVARAEGGDRRGAATRR